MVPEAIEAMQRELGRVGNASSLHSSGRAARRVVEEARESIAAHVGAEPAEVIFTSGGTESDNLAVKGAYWSQAARGRTAVVTSQIEHHAVLDAVGWLAASAGATARLLPVDDSRPDRSERAGRGRRRRHRPRLGDLGQQRGGHRPAGRSRSPRSPVPAGRGRTATRCRPSVSCRSTSRRSGLDLLSFTAHKLGGPYGIGALLARREVGLTPVQHGGGQERDVRSGTFDVAAVAGFAAALEVAVRDREAERQRVGALRDAAGRRRAARRSPTPAVHGPAEPDQGLPGRGQHRLPGLPRPTPLLMLLDAAGIDCSTGSACSAGVSQPSHVLIAMGADGRGCPLVAALLPRPHLDGGRRGRAAHRPARRQYRARPPRERVRLDFAAVKVLAAMSGGVDSAVAAARAVDAGHDVTGVHLALSKNPQSYRSGARGCCSREDAHDARRAADVLGIPFYIWDLSDRFAADVVEDFVAEYAAGRTPNPCLRCNEKIKFAAVLDRAVALGFDAVCTGHYARLVRTGTEVQLHRAVDARQGPVLRARRADL